MKSSKGVFYQIKSKCDNATTHTHTHFKRGLKGKESMNVTHLR